jgi:hypothetical protein
MNTRNSFKSSISSPLASAPIKAATLSSSNWATAGLAASVTPSARTAMGKMARRVMGVSGYVIAVLCAMQMAARRDNRVRSA